MFNLPESVKKDTEAFKSSLEEFLKGAVSASRFKGMRVPWGIYNHRGGGSYMARIRVPAGEISSDQLKAISGLAARFTKWPVHITTRQDIQLHGLRIEDAGQVLDELRDAGLSPRGGGGNTVRNIIACPFSGICGDEIFDVRGHATALSEYLLGQQDSFNLPRKLKFGFSACSRDCSAVMLEDLGFLAVMRDGRKGFKVFAAGGMGASPRLGLLLEEFLPEEDIGCCAAAVRNVFYKKGDRKNRHFNRLKFLVKEGIGAEEFKKLYRLEFERLKKEEYIALRDVKFPEPEAGGEKAPLSGEKGYDDFMRYSVSAQKQEGFSVVKVRLPQGNLEAGALSALSGLEKEFPGIQPATMTNQDIAFTWVRNADLLRFYEKLKGIISGLLFPETLLDIVACKGALTCNLGLCNSPGLAVEIEAVAAKYAGSAMFQRFDIKINGCPNACGHHPVGKIAFYGLVRKVDGRPVPFYRLLLGGRKEAERTSLAREIGMLPARNVPKFMEAFLKRINEEFIADDDVYEFIEKKASVFAAELLKNFAYVPPYPDDRSFYIDWGAEKEYSLEGIGPGECGAGVVDMIEADLADSRIALDEGNINKAMHLAARSLLIVRGHEPKTPEETFRLFKMEFIDNGIADRHFSDAGSQQGMEYAEKFLAHVRKIYADMDQSFNFKKLAGMESAGDGKKAEEKATAHFLDLKGVQCPINYVKIKLFMEDLAPSEELEVILDEGEPIENVPKSLESDGHRVLGMEKINGTYKVYIKKGEK